MAYPQHRQPGTLTPGEAATAWEAHPLSNFGLDSFYAAISAVLPDAPRDARALERMVNEGLVKVAGILWRDDLCALVAWVGRSDIPPDDVLKSAYRTAVGYLANLPRLKALRDFESSAPRGNA